MKASENEDNHFRELSCYERLGFYKIIEINGFAVPELIDYNDNLLIIEMTIVQPPFILDFGKAYLDSKPPYFYDAHVMRDWEEGEQERWEERWPIVRKLVSALQSFGIYYMDLNQRNIVFPRGD